MSFDPLPPVESVSSYTRPSRGTNNVTAASQLEGGLISSFFRSLLPGFNPQEVVNNQPAVQRQPGRYLRYIDYKSKYVRSMCYMMAGLPEPTWNYKKKMK